MHNITITKDGDVAILKIVGRLDHSRLPKDPEITEIIASTSMMIVDFSDCEYIGSTGLGTLITIHRATEKHPNYRIQFKSCNEHVKESLEVVGFSKFFEIV